MAGRERWVNLTIGVPLARDFTTTSGQGTPICIDTNTDLAYYLDGNTVTLIGSGGIVPVNPTLFGVLTTNTGAQNDTAILALFAALRAASLSVGFQSRSLARIEFPAGIFNFDSTIDLHDGTFDICGATVNDESGTTLKFPTGITGIRVQTAVTQGASGTRPAGETSGRSIIRNLRIDGAYSGTEAEAHGIQLRAAAFIYNVIISDFEGDGVYIVADAVGTGANANNFYLEQVRCIRNRNGFFIDGPDSNNGTLISCDASANRRWGFYDSCFLGNAYIACHTATNGWVVGAIPTAVTHSGNRYAVKNGQEVGASTNAPSGTATDNTWWYWISPGGTTTGVPAWLSGTTYRSGGAFFADDANARNIFVNCYSEGDQSPSQIKRPSMILNGLHGAGVKDTAAYLRAEFNGLHSVAPLYGDQGLFVEGGSLTIGLDTDNLSTNHNIQNLSGSNVFNLRVGAAWRGSWAFDAFATTFNHTGEIHHRIGTQFALVSILRTDVNGTFIIKDGAKLGYNTGTGGTITQLTSKSTGVTLNKATGQITMNNAALNAATSVSFTLTNSVITSVDKVDVWIVSGASADSYDIAITAVANGSCRIQVKNFTGGSLSEALVLGFMVTKGAIS